jgi:hypothetical protein
MRVKSDDKRLLVPVFNAVQIRKVKSIEDSVGKKDALS